MRAIKYIFSVCICVAVLLAAGCNEGNEDIPKNIPIEKYFLMSNDNIVYDKEYFWRVDKIYPDYTRDCRYSDRDIIGGKPILINDFDKMLDYIGILSDLHMVGGPLFLQISDYPYPVDIDFSKHTLLLAGGVSEFGISGISGTLQQIAPNKYRLSIELISNRVAIDHPWAMAFTTNEKLSDESEIELHLTTINSDKESIARTWKFVGTMEISTFGYTTVFGSESSLYGPESPTIGNKDYYISFSSEKYISGPYGYYGSPNGIYEIGDLNSIQIEMLDDSSIDMSDEMTRFVSILNNEVEFYAVSGDELRLYFNRIINWCDATFVYRPIFYLLFEKEELPR